MISTKKERIGWYFYDFANSAFYTTVITVFIGPYLTDIAKNAADTSGYLHLWGIPVYYGSLFAYVIALSVILQSVCLPLFGAVADSKGNKKSLLFIFAYLGSFSAMGLFFVKGNDYLLGSILLIISNLSFGISVVMYNSYLNDIAEPDRRDAVSSIGWAVGYVGGGLLLGLNLLLFTMRDSLGIPTGMAIRIILCSAGAWWAIFSLIPLLTLKSRKSLLIANNISFSSPFKKLFETIKSSKKYPQSILFLAAYLFYNDGIQSVIAISSVFGAKEIHLSMDILTIIILIVQFVAIIGALLFNVLSKKYGSRNSIVFSLILWIAVVVYAFGFLHTQNEFIVLAMVIGLVLGGSQALSRSLFSLIIPKGMEAEYYSLYEVSERGTSWMGPVLFGLSLQFTQSYRIAILSLIVFFVIGLILLSKFNLNKALSKLNSDGVQ